MVGIVDVSPSLQACNATSSTFRNEASAKAISVANWDPPEPSMPTSTGKCGDGNDPESSSWITATGQWAKCTKPLAIELRRPPPEAACGLRPTTAIRASFDRSISVGLCAEYSSLLLIAGMSPLSAPSSMILIAFERIC